MANSRISSNTKSTVQLNTTASTKAMIAVHPQTLDSNSGACYAESVLVQGR